MDLKTLHATKSIKARPARKRVGRGPGSGLGKTSGRGQKGAGSRSGHHMRDFYEGGQTPLMRRIPKRGFSNDQFQNRFAVLNVSDLEVFDDGTEVTPRLLEESGVLKQPLDGVKILGDGELTKKLTVKAHRFSKSALEKISAKGGEAVTLLPPREKGPKKKKKIAARAAGVAKAATAAKAKKDEEAAE
jgi:large subunit ribosomal protein L15